MSESQKTQSDAAKKAAEEAGDAKASKKAKASDASTPPAWQDPDYDGTLDGEQAMWRNKHLKRLADGHATKPAKADATK